MNEFIEQFLVEARELVGQATDDLLALEENPADRGLLDGVFRAFHTLKGSAGIIEFPAMERALHAVEDALARVRGVQAPMTVALVGHCLSSLDQVVQWLDEMERTGEPPLDASLAADAVVARFGETPGAQATVSVGDWLGPLLERNPGPRTHAACAVRYAPDADCFFRGQDPLAIIQAIPGLLTLDIEPSAPWPTLAELDPFHCRLVLSVLSESPPEAILAALQAVETQVEVRRLGGEVASDLSALGRDLLAAQIAMLEAAFGEGLAGRQGSAAKVAVNVLRQAGLEAEAAEVEQVAASGEIAPLIGVLRALLGGGLELRSAAERAAPVAEVAERAIRVDVARIDALVRLAGELTVVKNALGYAAGLAEQGADPASLSARLKEQHGLLGRLLDELQRSVLSIRVLPLRHVFQRFPRLVRDIGAELGKPVRLLTEGEETEADKAIVEVLFEPLLHVVRNAIGHGIEEPAVRARLGKPAVGTVRIRARREGEHVLIEVADDGQGIDVARIRDLAVQRGVVGAEALATMDEAEVIGLIFAPGFSTAQAVTGLSGRGVGMDAVRTAVERIGGRVDVESTPGEGATVRLTFPFTVMMTRVMTVQVGDQMFGVPLESVVETLRVPRDQIRPVGAGSAFVLRNRTAPVIDLAATLNTEQATARGDTAVIVVAAIGAQLAGLEVDRVGERMDVMLKPLDGLLAGMPGIAGATLLGDGRVLIVLDLEELLR